MSDASAPSSPSPAKTGRQQRRLRNFLLDKRFQLKYSGMLALVAVGVSGMFGVGLTITSQRLIEQNRGAVEQSQALVKQGQETVRRGQLAIEERKKVNTVVSMSIKKAYGDDPELAKEFGTQTADDDAKLAAEQKRLEDDAASLKKRAEDLERQTVSLEAQQRTLLASLVVALLVFVVCIGLAGIVVTHKVAGPIFKMSRMFGQVGDGHFKLRERLRKGDEMQSFFDAFEKMLGRLNDRQARDIQRIDEAIARIKANAPDDAAEMLEKLRSELQAMRDS